MNHDGPALWLGSVTPYTTEAVIEAFGKSCVDALRKNAAAHGVARDDQIPLSFTEFKNSLTKLDSLGRAYNSQYAGRTGYVHGDSVQLERFVTELATADMTPDAKGYAAYLAQVAPALWPVITKDVPATLPAVERRRHTYIVGATGSGKSELLKVIIAEHVRLDDSAVLVLDPHVDLARDVAQLPVVANSGRLIYASANVAPGHAVTVNPLEPPKGATVGEQERIAYHLAEALNSLSGGTATSRMVRFLRATIRVLLDRPGSTLLDLYALTSDNPPADILALGRKHPAAMVRSFFEEDINSADMHRARFGIRARLAEMLDASGFQAFTCGPSTIDLEQAIADRSILVFALGSLGKAVGTDVGLLLIALMTALGERRQVNEALPRSPVHIVVDECQLMVGESTVTILDEMRKFGVYLTLSQQRAGQGMPQAMKEAVLTGPAVKLCGQTDDAGDLMRLMAIEDRDTPQKLSADASKGLFQFACRWGRSAKPFILNVRGDLVGQKLPKDQWQDLLAGQIGTYYRPIRENRSSGGEAPADTAGSRWELK